MSSSALQQLCTLLDSAVLRRDGEQMRRLLRDPTQLTLDAITEFYESSAVLPSSLAQSLDDHWSVLPEVVRSCILASGSIRVNDWINAYDYLAAALTAYVSVLSRETGWALPLFHQLCEDMRVTAQVADDHLRESGERASKLESAERLLKRGFSTINNDRNEINAESKRLGTLGIINQLLKVYFKINNLGLCINLIKTVNTKNFPAFHLFPLPHRITYKYYAGRLNLYDDQYSAAVGNLTYALKYTPAAQVENRRRILLYLIPAKILTGSMPSYATLTRYRMKWYVQIVEAIRTGNLELFENGVAQYEEFFIKSALYLAIEKMKALVYRAFIRQVAHILGQIKIPLDNVVTCLGMCNIRLEKDEIECILANLIHQGYIKGYISHKVGFLVISKKNPFPPLRTLTS